MVITVPTLRVRHKENVMGFDPRTVSAGAIRMFGAKQSHPNLKEHNGEEVLVDAARDENGRTVIVVMTQYCGKPERLICAMSQR
jgi:hypothetical protein